MSKPFRFMSHSFSCKKFMKHQGRFDNYGAVGEANWDNVVVLKALLRGFEMVSGLRINYAKSQFGVIGGDVNWINAAAFN